MMKKLLNPIRKINFGIWILGILFSYIVTNLILSPQIQADRVLAAGQVYELRKSSLTSTNETWIYDAAQEVYTIDGNEAKMSYGKWNEAVDWKCMYLKLGKLNRDPVDWVIKAYDEGQFVGQQIVTVKNGENWIAMNIGVPFQKFSIQILGAEGLQFQIEEMVLLEEAPQKKKDMFVFAVIFLLFLIGYMFLKKKGFMAKTHGKFLENIGDFLQFCYRLVGNCEGFALGKSWSRQKKNRVRTGLFFFLFVYMWIVYNQNVYFEDKYFQYHSLVFALVMLLVARISKEKELTVCRWNEKTARYGLVFWMFVCVSDFVVSKQIRFIGWIMLLVVGLFLLVWKHMQYPGDIIKNLLCAVELMTVAGVLYSVLFQTSYIKNPVDFGVLSVFICLVFLVEIYDCRKKCEAGKKKIFYLCGLAVGIACVCYSIRSSVEAYQSAEFMMQALEEKLLVCKAYLREMNLFGHESADIRVWNKRQVGQNQILQIMYRYGVLAVIFYILLFVEAGKRAWNNLKKSWKKWESTELLSAGVIFFWWIIGFFGTVEYPFYQPAWLFVYLLLGSSGEE